MGIKRIQLADPPTPTPQIVPTKILFGVVKNIASAMDYTKKKRELVL